MQRRRPASTPRSPGWSTAFERELADLAPALSNPGALTSRAPLLAALASPRAIVVSLAVQAVREAALALNQSNLATALVLLLSALRDDVLPARRARAMGGGVFGLFGARRYCAAITPQATREPELPVGFVTRSSAPA